MCCVSDPTLFTFDTLTDFSIPTQKRWLCVMIDFLNSPFDCECYLCLSVLSTNLRKIYVHFANNWLSSHYDVGPQHLYCSAYGVYQTCQKRKSILAGGKCVFLFFIFFKKKIQIFKNTIVIETSSFPFFVNTFPFSFLLHIWERCIFFLKKKFDRNR